MAMAVNDKLCDERPGNDQVASMPLADYLIDQPDHRDGGSLSEHMNYVCRLARDSYDAAAGQIVWRSASSAAEVQRAVDNLMDPMVRSAAQDLKCYCHVGIPAEVKADVTCDHDSTRMLSEAFSCKVSVLAASLKTRADRIWDRMTAVSAVSQVSTDSACVTARSATASNHVCSAHSIGHCDMSEELCDSIGEDLIGLDRELRAAAADLAKLIEEFGGHGNKTAQSHVSNSASTVIGSALQSYLAKSVDVSTLLATLAQLYDKSRTRAGPESNLWQTWVPPNVFKRKTVKYWVREDSLMMVKTTLCRHIPVLAYTEKDGPSGIVEAVEDSSRLLANGRPALPSVMSVVNSTYFDNPVSMQAYERRVKRDHGAALVRMRWYSSDENGKTPPTQSSAVFLERKVHCKGGPSVKERVEVPESIQQCILTGEPLPETLSTQETAGMGKKAMLRMLDIKGQMDIQHQVPVVKTAYTRTAFQKQSCNAVRVTIDENFLMSDAAAANSTPVAIQPRRASQLTLPTTIPPGAAVRFTLSILEVKFEGDGNTQELAYLNSALQKLLQDQHIVKAAGYSKFQHAVGLLMSGTPPLPKWFVEINGSARPPTFLELVLRQQQAAKRQPSLMPVNSMSLGPPGTADENRTVDVPPTHLICPQSVAQGSAKPTQPRTMRRGARALFRPRGSLLLRLWPIGSNRDGGQHDRQAKGKKRKAEPRTFWSNERTFLSWISISVLLLFTGLALMDGSTSVGTPLSQPSGPTGDSTQLEQPEQGNSPTGHQIPGMVIAPVGLIFMLYALAQHRVRTMKILSTDESARYDDQIGPLLLVTLLLFVSATAFSMSVRATYM